MKKFSFEYNVPMSNHLCSHPDKFITVIVEPTEDWPKQPFLVTPVILGNHDLIAVKDWSECLEDMKRAALRQWESYNNATPILERFTKIYASQMGVDFNETYTSQLNDLS